MPFRWSRVVLFVLGALVVHTALSVVFMATAGRLHDVRRMDARWLMGPRPVRVMVAGDSHARYGVEGPILGSAINVAVPGEHYQKTLYRLQYLVDTGERPLQTVLLPFDAASFSSFKSNNFEPEYVWGRYVDFFDLGRRKGKPFRYGGKAVKAYAAPYVGELQTVLQLLTRTAHFRNTRAPASGLGMTVFEDGPHAAQRHLQGADPFDADMVWAFRALLDACRERGLRVVLIRYPVTQGYAREARRLGADPALRDALLEEVHELGVVDHLDFEDALVGEREVWGDGDHLNPIGKRKFSLLLRDALLELGVLKP